MSNEHSNVNGESTPSVTLSHLPCQDTKDVGNACCSLLLKWFYWSLTRLYAILLEHFLFSLLFPTFAVDVLDAVVHRAARLSLPMSLLIHHWAIVQRRAIHPLNRAATDTNAIWHLMNPFSTSNIGQGFIPQSHRSTATKILILSI